MRNILIAGYPRSGNTFLGYLLSYYFNAPYYDMHLYPRIASGELLLEDILLSKEAFTGAFERLDQEEQVNAILKSHKRPKDLRIAHELALDDFDYEEDDPLILITREPKDVAVSYFYYVFFRRKGRKPHWSEHLPYRVRHWYYRKFRFREFALRVANDWKEFVTGWIELEPLVIRYEDLVRDSTNQIQHVCEVFDLAFHPGYAGEAAEFCEFSNMSKLEDANPAFNTAHKSERAVRSGKSSQWQQFFDAGLQSRFDRITEDAAHLVGYGDRNTSRTLPLQ